MRLEYTLPEPLLARYHELLDLKFSGKLTPEEAAELVTVTADLDAADSATPLETAIRENAEREHERRMSVLEDVERQIRAMVML